MWGEIMHLVISNSSSVPIYEQIKAQIIEQIMNDELKEDEMLPSIRSLSKDIRISLMTIKKAYDQLESDGYIVSIAGKGTFVAPRNSNLVKEHAQKEIEDNIQKAIDLAVRYDISKDEIIDLVNMLYEGDNKWTML